VEPSVVNGWGGAGRLEQEEKDGVHENKNNVRRVAWGVSLN
jgi:hypothetical protein